MEESKEKDLLIEPLEKFLHFQEVILGKSYMTPWRLMTEFRLTK